MGWQDRKYAGEDDSGFRSQYGFRPPGRMSFYVMGACFLAFILQNMPATSGITEWGGLTFSGGRAFTQPWRWLTYQYLHGGAMHILFNLLGIYFFLTPLERIWGGLRAFVFYTAGGLAAGIIYGLIWAFTPYGSLLIGASGSILAALGACAVLFPEQRILLFFFFVPIRVMALLLALYYVLTIIGDRDLSNAAHLGGMVFGVATTVFGKGVMRKAKGQVQQFQIARDRKAEQRDDQVIDRILAKVSEQGMHSLTDSERKALKEATEAQRKREARRPGHHAW
jgi:rhomboid family protein